MMNIYRPKFSIASADTPEDSMEQRALPRMKTIKEITELSGLSYVFLRNLCLQNRIVHVRTGKKYLINYDRLIDYLNTGEHA